MTTMTVEQLVKELLKFPNQQMTVFFKIGNDLPMMAGVAIPVEKVSKEPVLTLDGQHQAVMLAGKTK